MGPTLLLTLTSDPLVQEAFQVIVKNRSLSFDSQRKCLLSKGGGGALPQEPTDEQIVSAVEILKNAKFVKESPAPIKEFNNYYVTGEGLDAARELSRFRAA